MRVIEHSDKHKYTVLMSEDNKWKHFRSYWANYDFNLETGYMASWGRTRDEDPLKFPSPHIADIEIDECCTGLRNDGVTCSFCYKSNTPHSRGMMTLDEFKHLIDVFPKSLTQVAIGSSACLNTNPYVWDMMRYCRENDIVPNVTLANVLNDEIADNLASLAGACAISVYDDFDIVANSVKKLTDRGMTQINLHLLVAEEYFDRCMETLRRVKEDPRLSKLNAVVFLGLKQAGRGKTYNRMSDEHFKEMIEYAMSREIGIGFDSCSSLRALEVLGEGVKQSVIDCEATLLSSYFNCRGEYSPCSFMEQTEEWKHGISVKDVNSTDEFIDKIWNHERTEKFRQTLLHTCDKNKFECRECPYYTV